MKQKSYIRLDDNLPLDFIKVSLSIIEGFQE